MFEHWETYYLMIGTSAAALIGVMFIVTTLTAEIAIEQINRGVAIYKNPIVFHLAVIVATSALVMVPEHLLVAIAAALAGLGLVGLGYAALTIRRMFERYEFYQATGWDKLYYGYLPAVLYLVMGAGALSVFSAPELAAEAVGLATLLLLLVSIRNAWDVATFAVRIARSLSKPDEPTQK